MKNEKNESFQQLVLRGHYLQKHCVTYQDVGQSMAISCRKPLHAFSTRSIKRELFVKALNVKVLHYQVKRFDPIITKSLYCNPAF